MISRKKQIKIYKKFRRGFFSLINFFFLNPVNLEVFKRVAKYGYNSDKCLKKGFLPLPVHFYSPVPDIADLVKRKIWDKKSSLAGIKFDVKPQLSFLKNLGKNYGKECQWPLEQTDNPAEFFLDNNGFSYGCAAILYSIIREARPNRIIEIGSGNSSQVISQAILANQKEGKKTYYTIIDPYPGDYVKKRAIKYNKLIRQNVEETDAKLFEGLGKGDILFIDSSHIVKIGNDVNFLYLDVLSRLKPGVMIHIHDISLPYEYPKIYTTDEAFRQLWTEQYLLQAFLIDNHNFEVSLAMHYIMKNHLKDFKKAFPYYQPQIHKLTSGSFWIKRKKNDEK